MDLVSLAGTLFSGVNLINDLAATYRDLRSWRKEEREVDFGWLELAKSKGLITDELSNYEWIREEGVPTAELKDTAHTVFAYNDKERVVYKIVVGNATTIGGRLVLVRKAVAPISV
jgi:hypothetical protein